MAATDVLQDGETLLLPRRLDLGQAAGLRQSLLDRRGAPVLLDAGDVAHLGGLCLQVLLAAAQGWRDGGLAFGFRARSAAFDAALVTCSMPLSALLSAGPKWD